MDTNRGFWKLINLEIALVLKLPNKFLRDGRKNFFLKQRFSKIWKKARKEIEGVFGRYAAEVGHLQSEYDAISKKLDSKFIFEGITPTDEERKLLKKAKENLDSVKISKYSLTNVDEFTAESFADVEVGENPSKYSKEVHSIIVKYFGKGK